MSNSNRKFIVVGAGLSGLCVCIQLIDRGEDVTLVDNGVNHSSIIAAGMITPLVFRRMTKSWRVDEFSPYIQSFYRRLEAETNTSFFQSIQMRRMFSSLQERELWLKKQSADEFQEYMAPLTPEDDAYDRAINKHGSGRLKNAANVQTSDFLHAATSWVSLRGKLLHESFDYSLLSGNQYKDQSYTDIIFCEGYLGKENPWFGKLPLTQTKGETLTIYSKDIPEDESINRKCFVLPLGNQTFKIGSTYIWDNADLSTTEEGKQIMLENLSHLTSAPITILDQAAGIRPTTTDRRPLIGTHPEIKSYHIFNGLGAKGYLIAPLLSKEFVDYLLDGTPLDKEVDIARCRTLSQ